MSMLSQKAPISIPVQNFLTAETYSLVSLDQSQTITDSDLETIVSICNEPLIYDLLFRKKYKGQPYPRSSAEGFVERARRGWNEDNQYIFVIRNSQGRIVGALDLKSGNLDLCEIGYWLSVSGSGVMSNAVVALTTLARSCGYKKLFALVRPENERSRSVLSRCRFNNVGEENGVERTYYRYELVLAN